MTTNDAKNLGRIAYEQGRMCAPILEPKIVAALDDGRAVGDPDTLRLFKAFATGYHEAEEWYIWEAPIL